MLKVWRKNGKLLRDARGRVIRCEVCPPCGTLDTCRLAAVGNAASLSNVPRSLRLTIPDKYLYNRPASGGSPDFGVYALSYETLEFPFGPYRRTLMGVRNSSGNLWQNYWILTNDAGGYLITAWWDTTWWLEFRVVINAAATERWIRFKSSTGPNLYLAPDSPSSITLTKDSDSGTDTWWIETSGGATSAVDGSHNMTLTASCEFPCILEYSYTTAWQNGGSQVADGTLASDIFACETLPGDIYATLNSDNPAIDGQVVRCSLGNATGDTFVDPDLGGTYQKASWYGVMISTDRSRLFVVNIGCDDPAFGFDWSRLKVNVQVAYTTGSFGDTGSPTTTYPTDVLVGTPPTPVPPGFFDGNVFSVLYTSTLSCVPPYGFSGATNSGSLGGGIGGVDDGSSLQVDLSS